MKLRLPLVLPLLLLAATTSTWATDFLAQSGDYTCEANQTLTNELWLSARTIDIKGQAMDDLLLFAEASTGMATNVPPTLQMGGVMHGSVWAAGESVVINGIIARHTRLVGFRVIQIAGRIERNLIALGSTISIPSPAFIAGDALVAGREVVLEGTVGGNTRIYAESITLSGSFTGNVTLVAATINIMPGTRIGGDLHYRMNQDLILDSNVLLKGKLIREEIPTPTPRKATAGDLLLQLALCMASLLAGLVFVSIFPGIAGLCLHRLTDSFWKCLLIGFVAGCLIPMTAFFLLFTFIGIPLSILAILAYLILVYLGKIVAALYVGHRIVYRRANPPVMRLLPQLAIGLLIIYTAALLPFPVDILVWFTFTLLGMGAIVGAILDRRTPVMVAVSGDELPPAPPPLPGKAP